MIHTQGVSGSNPLPPTILYNRQNPLIRTYFRRLHKIFQLNFVISDAYFFTKPL